MAAMFLIGTTEVMAGPMLREIGRHFGIPGARAAWLSAAHALTYATLAPFLGPVSDRIGRKALLVPGLVGLAAATCGVALAPSFEAALVASVLAGCCAAAIQPNALAIVNDHVHNDLLPRAVGRVFMGLTLSFVLVPPLSGLLAARVDWRAVYALVAALALLDACLVARLKLPARIPGPKLAFRQSFIEALSLPGVRRRLLASFLWLGLCIGLVTLLPEIARRRFALSTETVGLLAGAFGLATVAGNSLTGLAKRLGPERTVVFGAAASIGGALIVGAVPGVPSALALVAGAVWAVGYGIAGPTLHSTLSRLSGRVRGTVTALQASLLNLGIMAVAFGTGRYLDGFGVPALVLGTAVLMAAGVALLATFTRTAQ